MRLQDEACYVRVCTNIYTQIQCIYEHCGFGHFNSLTRTRTLGHRHPFVQSLCLSHDIVPDYNCRKWNKRNMALMKRVVRNYPTASLSQSPSSNVQNQKLQLISNAYVRVDFCGLCFVSAFLLCEQQHKIEFSLRFRIKLQVSIFNHYHLHYELKENIENSV